MNKPKRTRRTQAQIEADKLKAGSQRESGRTVRSSDRKSRADIRQKTQKPLKLDVSSVKRELESQLEKKLQLKWVRHKSVSHHQEIGWNVVGADLKTQINKYTPDGRLKGKGENIQEADGGAYTAEVGNGEFNFLMYKDLETYLQEDAVWNKEEADRPMDSIQSSGRMGEEAGLGGDVRAYQPKQDVKIEKQRDAY
jgi:hypothetical protein